mmetsp:Transcript_18241/g.35840  ORF Transcript_18241/g.35840 Transcript_18241/m.35840 type:complete len:463 (+) Transcript_18241:283-1671(+)
MQGSKNENSISKQSHLSSNRSSSKVHLCNAKDVVEEQSSGKAGRANGTSTSKTNKEGLVAYATECTGGGTEANTCHGSTKQVVGSKFVTDELGDSLPAVAIKNSKGSPDIASKSHISDSTQSTHANKSCNEAREVLLDISKGRHETSWGGRRSRSQLSFATCSLEGEPWNDSGQEEVSCELGHSGHLEHLLITKHSRVRKCTTNHLTGIMYTESERNANSMAGRDKSVCHVRVYEHTNGTEGDHVGDSKAGVLLCGLDGRSKSGNGSDTADGGSCSNEGAHLVRDADLVTEPWDEGQAHTDTSHDGRQADKASCHKVHGAQLSTNTHNSSLKDRLRGKLNTGIELRRNANRVLERHTKQDGHWNTRNGTGGARDALQSVQTLAEVLCGGESSLHHHGRSSQTGRERRHRALVATRNTGHRPIVQVIVRHRRAQRKVQARGHLRKAADKPAPAAKAAGCKHGL